MEFCNLENRKNKNFALFQTPKSFGFKRVNPKMSSLSQKISKIDIFMGILGSSKLIQPLPELVGASRRL